MKGINFKEANSKAGWGLVSQINMEPLPVYTDGHACVSVWELTDEDIALIIKTRRIELLVCTSPLKHPDVGLSVESILPNNPFIKG
jgi:hypothetical protein